jgi:predicted transcriptional regulator
MRPPAKWYESLSRLDMMIFLSESPRSRTEIQKATGMTLGNLYTHSMKLEEDGLISQSKETPVTFNVTAEGWNQMAEYAGHAQNLADSFRLAMTFSNRL